MLRKKSYAEINVKCLIFLGMASKFTVRFCHINKSFLLYGVCLSNHTLWIYTTFEIGNLSLWLDSILVYLLHKICWRFFRWHHGWNWWSDNKRWLLAEQRFVVLSSSSPRFNRSVRSGHFHCNVQFCKVNYDTLCLEGIFLTSLI